MGAAPYGVELFESGVDEFWRVGEYAGFEVAAVGAFHAYARSGEVGGANVGCPEVENEDFEMDARTEHAFETCREYGIAPEVFLKYRAGLLGVNQANFGATLQ